MPKQTRGFRKGNKTSVLNSMASVGQEKLAAKRKASVEWTTQAMPTASKNQPKIIKETATVSVAKNKLLNKFDFCPTQSQAKPLDTQELQNIRKAITTWKPPTRKTACSEALQTQTLSKDKISKVSQPHTVSPGIWHPPLRKPPGTMSQTVQQTKNLLADIIIEKHHDMEAGNKDVQTSMDFLRGVRPTMKSQQTSVTQPNTNSTVTQSLELLGAEEVLVQKTQDMQHKNKTETGHEVIQMCPENQVVSLTSLCIQEKLAMGKNEIKEDSDDEIFYFRPNTKSVVDDIHSDSDESVIENSQPIIDKVSQMSKISRSRATTTDTQRNKEVRVMENVTLPEEADVEPSNVSTPNMDHVSPASSLHTPPNNPEIDFSKCPQLKRDNLRKFIYDLPVEPLQTQVIPEYYEERDLFGTQGDLFGTQEDPVEEDMPPSKKAKRDQDVSDDWITNDCTLNADTDVITPPCGKELSFSQCSTVKREDTEDNEMQAIIMDVDFSNSFAEKADILQRACRTMHETESMGSICKALSDLSDVFPTDYQESRSIQIATGEAISTGNDMDVCESVVHKSQESVGNRGLPYSVHTGHANTVYATDNTINVKQDEDINASNVKLLNESLITEQVNSQKRKKEIYTSSQELQSLNNEATAVDLTRVNTSLVTLDNKIKDVTTGNEVGDRDVLHVNQDATKGENKDIPALTSNDLISNDTRELVANSLNNKSNSQKHGLGFDHSLVNSVVCDKQTEKYKLNPLMHSTEEQARDEVCQEKEVSCTIESEDKAGNDTGFKPSKIVKNESVSNKLQPSSTQIHTTQQPTVNDILNSQATTDQNEVETSAEILDGSNAAHTEENVLKQVDLEPRLAQICPAQTQPYIKVHVPQEKIDDKREEEISATILKGSSNVKTQHDETEGLDLLLHSTEKPMTDVYVIASQPVAKETAEDETMTLKVNVDQEKKEETTLVPQSVAKEIAEIKMMTLKVNVDQEKKEETILVSQPVAKETAEDETMTLKVIVDQEQNEETTLVSQPVAKETAEDETMTLKVNVDQEQNGKTTCVSQPEAKERVEDKTPTLKENVKEQKKETALSVPGNQPSRNEERKMTPLTVELSQDFEFSYSQIMQIESDYKKEMKREAVAAATRKPPFVPRTVFTPREGTVAPGPGNASLQCGNAQVSSPYVPIVTKMPQMKWMKTADDDRKKLRAVIADISKLNAMLLQVRRTVWPANGNAGVAPLNAAPRPIAGDVMQPVPSGSAQPVAFDVTQPAQSSVIRPAQSSVVQSAQSSASRLAARSIIHPGQSNVTSAGQSGMIHPGQNNIPQPDSRAFQYSGVQGNVNHPGQGNVRHPGQANIPHPGQGNVNHPGQGNVRHPGQANIPHPGQGNVQHPGQGNVRHPGQSNVPHPGLGSVFRPRARNMPQPRQSYMPRPNLGNKPQPDPGTRRY